MGVTLPEEFSQDSNRITVAKSMMYHMIHSFIKVIAEDKKLSKQEKYQGCFDYGF